MTLAASSFAQMSQDAERIAARNLAQDGDRLAAVGKFEDALDRFSRACALVRAPTLLVRQAHCLKQLGRLVEASETYRLVTRWPLSTDSPQQFREAVDEASRALEELSARIPQLVIRVSGTTPSESVLAVDGNDVPAALWGVKWPVDPGRHVVVLTRASAARTRELVLTEGQVETIVMEFATAPVDTPTPATSRAAAPPVPPPYTAVPVHSDSPSAGGTNSARAWGWVGVGVGATSLAVGTAAWLLALDKQEKFDSQCVDAWCPPALRNDIDSYNRYRMMSTVGILVGAGLLGASGFVLLRPEAGAPQHRDAGIQLRLGLPGGAIEGQF